MNTFKTTLFKLLNSNAVALTIVDGYEIDSIDPGFADANGSDALRCSCSDDHEWYFVDQEVTVTDGQCKVMTAPGDWDTGMDPFEATLEFRVARPVEEADLEGKADGWTRIIDEEPPLGVKLWLVRNNRQVVEGMKTWRQGWDPDHYIIEGMDMSIKEAGVTHWKLYAVPDLPSDCKKES